MSGVGDAGTDGGAPFETLLELVPEQLPPIELGKPYSHQFVAKPADIQVSFTLAGGTLPTGLIMTPTGELNGTPTESGDFLFQVEVASGTGRTIASFTLSVVRRAWLMYRADDRQPAINELFAVNVGGTQPLRSIVVNHDLAPSEQVDGGSAVWSPDGSFVSYTTEGGPNGADVYLVDMRGLVPGTPVSIRDELWHVKIPSAPWVRWSPDSSAFVVGNSRNYYVIEVEDGRPVEASTLGYAERVTWSPDGTSLAYTMTQGASSSLFVRPREAGSASRQVVVNDSVSHAYFTPDGEKLWFNGESGDLYFASLTSSQLEATKVNGPRVNLLGANANWPSNEFICYVAPGVVTGQHEIYRARFASTPDPQAVVTDIDTSNTGMDYRDINPRVLGNDTLLAYKVGTNGTASVRQHVQVLASGQRRSWNAAKSSHISQSRDGTLALVPELHAGEVLSRCAINPNGLDECYDLNDDVPGFGIYHHEFSPDAQGAILVGNVEGEPAKTFYADLRGDVRRAVLLHEEGEAYGGVYPAFDPEGRYVAMRLKDGNATVASVVDVSRQLPGAPIRVSGDGIVTDITWQPK